MLRCTTRLVALLCASLALLGVLAMPAQAKPGGNAGASAACADGGYLTYTTADGTAFKNEGQCVKYAAKGNPLVEDPAVTRCKQEAVAAGITPTGFTIIAGTEGYDEAGVGFNLTAGPDLICGFGDDDYIYSLGVGDVFLGGVGMDEVSHVDGTFNGGAGGDYVHAVQSGGTFNGGDGDDDVMIVASGGTFNGGAGFDEVRTLETGGTFNQD